MKSYLNFFRSNFYKYLKHRKKPIIAITEGAVITSTNNGNTGTIWKVVFS